VSTQVPQAIDKLVALFTAALPGVLVADGPQTTFPTARWAVVGGDGPVQEEEDAARAVQQWNGLGARVRNEQIDVVCAVGSSTGNAETTLKTRRDDAYALLGPVEAALRADPGLGGFTTGGAAAVTETALKYVTNSAGVGAVVVFTINIPVRS
jgi:hypothetical protein